MPIKAPKELADGYDLVIAGSGFGSLFFLHRFVKARPKAKVLILEWGKMRPHAWQIENRKNGDVKDASTFVATPGEKPWSFTIGFGGGTNCWWAQTPRWMPNDFRLHSLYGVGRDWPIGYHDLEPYYLEAERIMMIAGPNDLAQVYPRSGPYPQPPHALSDIDRKMKLSMPERHFAVPCARLRIPVGARGACCMSNQCDFCPR
jgi:choline dehydrogenase-like flavoprotein